MIPLNHPHSCHFCHIYHSHSMAPSEMMDRDFPPQNFDLTNDLPNVFLSKLCILILQVKMSSHICIILIIDQFTFPQAEVFVWTGWATTSFPSAANSSARPQEQFLQAFLLPVVPHTLKQKNHQLCISKDLHVQLTKHATQLLFDATAAFLKKLA